jgi:glycerophosphoryl diester phosphodiesterase
MSWLTKRPIAHRGLHADHCPENSLSALEAAINEGYPVEVDVRLTRDGVPVLFHDRTLDRLTGMDGRLEQTTWRELERLRLLDSDQRVPSLADALALVDGQVPLLLELKTETGPGPLESAVAAQLDAYDGSFAVQSFNPRTVAWFRQNRPAWTRGQLYGRRRPGLMEGLKGALLDRLPTNLYSRPHFVGVHHESVTASPTSGDGSSDLPLLAWTVRTRTQLDRVAARVDNVIFEGIRP